MRLQMENVQPAGVMTVGYLLDTSSGATPFIRPVAARKLTTTVVMVASITRAAKRRPFGVVFGTCSIIAQPWKPYGTVTSTFSYEVGANRKVVQRCFFYET